MLSVAKLTLGQEAYYEQQVARGVDDYYAGRGESPGIWAGSGSAGLGLVGVVEDGDLGTLLRGVNPADAERLRSPVRERAITVRTLDVESGEWREEQKRLAPVSGYDLVFSCPKSVSLLHALTDEAQVRREISEAHEASWQAALAYLEREACVVRRGKGGAIREHGAGFVGAAFRHRTSRAQDPHLHTHVIVANMTRTEHGEWRALDGEAILKSYRLAAGYLYEAQLRHELTVRLGVEWTEPVKGMAEIAGTPEEAMRAFSTRRQSLLEHMEALGTEGFAAARVAALATREAKEQSDLPRLRQDWQARAAEHGLGRRELETLVNPRPVPHRQVEREQLAARLFGRDGLTEKRTTFTMPELVRAVAGSAPSGASVDEVLEAAEELSRFPGVELIEPGDTPGRPARFTTRELVAVEREALALALAGRDADAPRPDRKLLLRTLIRADGLTNEQRHLVHDASLSRDRVVCVVGVAGAGKTTALRALSDAHRDSNVVVLGAAPSGRAADELQAATGIPSRTMHRLLLDGCEQELPRGCVLVVDEAGMAETRVLAPLLRLVEHAQGKALLIGDPAQLPSVGAGGLYPALCERLGTIELGANHRQRDPLEREALATLRGGNPEPYLAHAAERGRLAVDDDPTAAKQRLLADWWQTAQRNRADNVMLAYRRDDVRELNQAAQALMHRSGRLGREAATFGDREFRVRRPSRLPTEQCPARRPQRHPRHDHRPRPQSAHPPRRRAESSTGSRSATPPRTSSTATRSPATPRKEPPSTAPTSSSATRAHSRSGAMSRAHVPASRPASTSPTATGSSARCPCTSPTWPRLRNAPPAPSNARPPSRSRSTRPHGRTTSTPDWSPDGSRNSNSNAPKQPSNSRPPGVSSTSSAGGTAAADASSSRPRSRSGRLRSEASTRRAQSWS